MQPVFFLLLLLEITIFLGRLIRRCMNVKI